MEITTAQLQQKRLRYTKEKDLSIKRIRQGKGFRYRDEDGKTITDTETKNRINKLAIPPAWDSVRISKSENTHIQAIGYDDRERKQYIYHPKWIELQQRNKFSKVIFFGEVLPSIRTKIKADLNQKGLGKERIIATIIWLLENTLIRVGNERYAQDNKSYGLTTLKNKHVDVDGSDIHFEFKGKSGVYHSVDIKNKKVAQVITACQDLPGQQLFEYIAEDGTRHDIDSEEVNEYLKAITGEDITAKDFRTWGGTVYAGDALNTKGMFENKTQAKRNITDTVKEVASHLRNTPATCKTYYIHPQILTSYEKKILVPHYAEIYNSKFDNLKLYLPEYASWTLLKSI
ncbi:MAG TPA: DNA topoisomerase IB [Candidatus Woesebacteria bacterium]|nr:DNA topoisomerase IB [Candidatus Woesebacteria bacterium]